MMNYLVIALKKNFFTINITINFSFLAFFTHNKQEIRFSYCLLLRRRKKYIKISSLSVRLCLFVCDLDLNFQIRFYNSQNFLFSVFMFATKLLREIEFLFL
jgi:hypothetical protein